MTRRWPAQAPALYETMVNAGNEGDHIPNQHFAIGSVAATETPILNPDRVN